MFDRFAVDFSAEVRPPEMQDSDFAQCCDVSASGAGLLSDEKLSELYDIPVAAIRARREEAALV